MNAICIEGLRIETHIGVHDWEKKIKQALILDIKIPRDFKALTETDDQLEKTLDYDALCQHVIELIESKSFNLIETVAHTVLTSIQKTFKLQAVSLRVAKPHAINQASNIFIELTSE